MAGLLVEKGVQLSSLNGIAMAFLNKANDLQKKKEVICELKQMINELEREN